MKLEIYSIIFLFFSCVKKERIIYSVNPEDLDDDMISNFVRKYFKPFYPSNKKPLLQHVVPISTLRFKNGLQATACERYGIKGLKLKHDCVIWSMIIDYEYSIYKYPSNYRRAGKFLEYLQKIEFYEDFPEEWQCISKMIIIGIYAAVSIYRYRSRQSLSFWCRYLSEYIGLLFFKLFCEIKSFKNVNKILFKDLDFIWEHGGFLFDAEERTGLFFRHDFYQKMYDITLEKFAVLCGCSECRELLLIQTGRLRKEPIYINLRMCPELGKIEVPILPHSGEFYVSVFEQCFSKDLCMSIIDGQLEVCRFPVMLDAEHSDSHSFVLLLLTNITFLLFVSKTIYAIIQKEIELYHEMFKKEVYDFCVHIDRTVRIGAVGCISKQENARFINRAKDIFEKSHKKSNFIECCMDIIKIAVQIPEYRDYANKSLVKDFFEHYLEINRKFNTDEFTITAENLTPGFFLVNSGDQSLVDILDNSLLSVSDDYLSNLKDVDSTISLYFSGLKNFLSNYTSFTNISHEKDVRTLEFRLGTSTAVKDWLSYYVLKNEDDCIDDFVTSI